MEAPTLKEAEMGTCILVCQQPRTRKKVEIETQSQKNERIAKFDCWEITWRTPPEDAEDPDSLVSYGYHPIYAPRSKMTFPAEIPDYMEDRDAIIELATSLPDWQREQFLVHLAENLKIAPWRSQGVKNFVWEASLEECMALVLAPTELLAESLLVLVP